MSGDISRRKMLGMTGVSIGALVGSSGNVSADGNNNQVRALKVEDGRFVLDHEKVGKQQYKVLKQAVEDFNEQLKMVT